MLASVTDLVFQNDIVKSRKTLTDAEGQADVFLEIKVVKMQEIYGENVFIAVCISSVQQKPQ